MKRDVHATLSSEFATCRIVRQIHDVPPHDVYEVHVDGRRAIIKVDTGPTGRAATEGRVIAFVGERTTLPVPEILMIGDDHFVASWHPDAPAPEEEQGTDETWAYAAGRGLATLHDETDPWIDEHGRFRPRGDRITIDGHDGWHEAAVAYVRRRRSILAKLGHADIADVVVEHLEDHPNVFEGAGGPVCCHGWATPEHVTVVDGRVACLVDFEHAIAAPGEFDYWRTALPTFGPDVEAPARTFREGYESVRSLPAGFERRKPVYVALIGLYYIESLYVQDEHGPAETAERAEQLRNGVANSLESFP